MRKVVITGLGVVSPVGNKTNDFFDNLMSGKSGVRSLSAAFSQKLSIRVAAEADFDPSAHFSRMKLGSLDRFSQFALVAARDAVEDSALALLESEKRRSGVYLGTGIGGIGTIEEGYVEIYTREVPRFKPLTVLMAMNNAAASQISLEYGLQGPNVTYSTACSSSSIAIGEAYRLIKHGYADVMVAGGSEALLTFGTISAWISLRTLALPDEKDISATCKPFSKDRTGLVLGEGAAVLVLEEAGRALARGAKIYGEIIGYGAGSDACHITKPSMEGQVRSMKDALNDAGIAPEEIDHINAHGTGTAVGDAVETAAIREVFGQYAYRIPVTSTKSMHGHMMGATGAVEFMAALLAIKNRSVPPTANLDVPDPECDLDYVPNVGRRGLDIRTVMSNSFAFGGSNAVLIAREFES
ncbi:MAG: beta-ketoacyl-[acyl-carrier-protein] synthase family protein [Burkholderiales bacterium]|nr:beta-ketoacyl-[acyl-carrier-protein] synthase family protein [Burkholderiales bacterium]